MGDPEERENQMAEGIGRQLDMIVAAGAQRVKDCNDGKRWFHAWIGSRHVRATATPSRLGMGSDTLHESIIAFQGGRRLATSDIHHGYRPFGEVQGRRQAYEGDTSCDFAIQSAEPILISYCCANLSTGNKGLADSLNIALLQDYVHAADRDGPVDFGRLARIAGAVAELAATVATGSFLLVLPAVRAVANVIRASVGNRDGPLAFGVIFIENPKDMLADDNETNNSPFRFAKYRCQNFSYDSDYEIECKIKPMNQVDRNRIGIA